MSALTVEALSHHFGGLRALDAVGFAVAEGERLVILGPNGAGKTTLFNLITGLFRPSTGRISLLGRDVTRLAPHRRARLGLGRIDVQLAAMDRWLGFDWPQIMSLAAGHPFENGLLRIIYGLVLPQMAVLIICLGWRKKPQEIYRFCCAVVAGAAMTIAFWAMFPSFGAFSVYELSPSVASRLSLELDGRYAHDLVHMLASGPGRISPHELKGLIGFPSFHAALAGLLIWYAWSVPVLRWPLIVLNSLVFVSTPIQGGHHVVDVVAGIAVAAIAIAATGYLSNWLERRSASAAQHSRAGAALPAGVPSQAFADS